MTREYSYSYSYSLLEPFFSVAYSITRTRTRTRLLASVLASQPRLNFGKQHFNSNYFEFILLLEQIKKKI